MPLFTNPLILYVLQCSHVTARLSTHASRHEEYERWARRTEALFSDKQRDREDPVPIESPSTPPSCPTHQSTPHINSRRTADNGPLSNGGPKASLRLYCSTALGNRRTLDQTQAKMNRNVEHLKNPFSSVARRATVYFKGLRAQWATWWHLWSNKQSPTRDRH